jgi:hypothetical protein
MKQLSDREQPRALEALKPEFVSREGLAHVLSCGVRTIDKLRKKGIIGEPIDIDGMLRWHWPTVRDRLLVSNVNIGELEGDQFLARLGSTDAH